MWESTFRRIRRLENSWAASTDLLCYTDEDLKVISKEILDLILFSERPIKKVIQYASGFGINFHNAQALEEAINLREVLIGFPFRNQIFDDVYAAAIYLFQNHRNNTGWFCYRGQANSDWENIASIFRSENFETEVGKVNNVVNSLHSIFPNRSPIELLAIAQHYAKEFNCKTWLLDFTWNPFVALFFASREWDCGELGKVFWFAPEEWRKYGASGTNPMGKLTVLELNDVERISAQEGIFIDSGHPELFNLFVPHSLTFRQKKGVVFSDYDDGINVNEEKVYPKHDVFLEKIQLITPKHSSDRQELKPPYDARALMTSSHYLEIARSIYPNRNYNKREDRLLEHICEFFAQCQVQRSEIDIIYRSIHRFEDAVHRLNAGMLDVRPYLHIKKGVPYNIQRDLSNLTYMFRECFERALCNPEQKKILLSIAKKTVGYPSQKLVK